MRYFVCPVGSVHYSFLSGIASAGTMYPEQDVVRPARIRKTCTVYFKSRLPLQICKCLQIYFNTQFSKHAAITLPLPGDVHAYVIFNMVLIASRCVTTHKSRTVSDTGIADDGGPNPLSGYSIVMADNIDAAVAMARDCPIIGNGSVEVAEIHEFTM